MLGTALPNHPSTRQGSNHVAVDSSSTPSPQVTIQQIFILGGSGCDGTPDVIDQLKLEMGEVVGAINNIELSRGANPPTGHRILISGERPSEKYRNSQASERLYSFKISFARQMVSTYGRLSDYERLRKVQEEARLAHT